MKLSWLKDANGKTSSKRIHGTLLTITGLLMGITTWVFALYNGDGKTALEIIALFLALGAGVTGMGVFDKVFKK